MSPAISKWAFWYTRQPCSLQRGARRREDIRSGRGNRGCLRHECCCPESVCYVGRDDYDRWQCTFTRVSPFLGANVWLRPRHFESSRKLSLRLEGGEGDYGLCICSLSCDF